MNSYIIILFLIVLYLSFVGGYKNREKFSIANKIGTYYFILFNHIFGRIITKI